MSELIVHASQLISHRAGSTSPGIFRQGWNGETGGTAPSNRWTGHMFFNNADFAPLNGKIIDSIILRMTATSWGNSGSYAFWIKKSPYLYSSESSHLNPNDYYPAQDIYDIASYIETPTFARSETHDTSLSTDYLQHVMSGYGLATYRRSAYASPTSSEYTREVTDPPQLIITYHDAITACTAPSTATLSAALSEGNVNVNYSGAAGGTNNAISSLEAQYAESNDNSSWGAWVAYSVFSTSSGSGSISVAPSSTRGKYRKFQIRVRGTAGVDWYSVWKAVSGSVRKNSAPTPPTSLAATPSLRESGAISITWSGHTDTDSNIDHFDIEYCTKPSGGSYGSWVSLGTDTASPYSHTPTLSDGTKIKYQVRSVDAFEVASTWKESNEVIQNSAPLTPVILFPGAGKTTYNTQPYVGLTISAEPNGQSQTLYYSIDGGATQNAGTVAAGTKKIRMPVLTVGSHTLRFWLQDSQGATSGEASVTITVATNTYTRAITGYVSDQQPGTLLWDEANSLRTSAEILELKGRVNQVRSFYGLTAISLPYEATTGTNTIKHFHTWMPNFAALYQGLADTETISGASVPTRVIKERNAPSAAVINQIRAMIGSL